MFDLYDRKGRPISVEEYGELTRQQDYKILKQTHLDSGIWISTVWLGLDHNYGDQGPPLIFETMVFESLHNWGSDVDVQRYSTEDEALKGHDELCELYENED